MWSVQKRKSRHREKPGSTQQTQDVKQEQKKCVKYPFCWRVDCKDYHPPRLPVEKSSECLPFKTKYPFSYFVCAFIYVRSEHEIAYEYFSKDGETFFYDCDGKRPAFRDEAQRIEMFGNGETEFRLKYGFQGDDNVLHPFGTFWRLLREREAAIDSLPLPNEIRKLMVEYLDDYVEVPYISVPYDKKPKKEWYL